MTSTRFQLPKATPAEVVQGALRKHAQTWIQRFYRHDLLVARTIRGLQADAVETFRIEVVGPVIRQLAAQLAEFPDRGADIAINSSPQLRRMIEQAEAIVRAGVEKLQRDVQAGLREVVGQALRDSRALALAQPAPVPPLRALLHLMHDGQWEGRRANDPAFGDAKLRTSRGNSRAFTQLVQEIGKKVSDVAGGWEAATVALFSRQAYSHSASVGSR